ncbi:MAG: hypothetical protein FJZ11_03955, partial [Candidatus Omnitrophica bacterium]|nr:hypothetical protein [Candidatus Omnitrophota bacterium]
MKKLKALSIYQSELLKTICIVLVASAIYFFFLSNIRIFTVPKLKAQDLMTRLAHAVSPPPKNIDKIV